MSTVQDDLKSFHEFATQRLADAANAATLDELFMEWHDSQERPTINEALRRGLADLDAGRFDSADAVMESIRQEFGFAKQ